jgi:hypothetical protein
MSRILLFHSEIIKSIMFRPVGIAYAGQMVGIEMENKLYSML